MGVSVSLPCLFVHEPPYQTTLVCCIPVFRRCLSRMDRVGLAQACPNKYSMLDSRPRIALTRLYDSYLSIQQLDLRKVLFVGSYILRM